MAVITTTTTTAGYVPPQQGYYACTDADGLADTDVITNVNKKMDDFQAKAKSIFHVTAVGDTNTIATGLKGVTAVFWMGDDVDDDVANWYVSAIAANGEATIKVNTDTGDKEGWILVLHDE